MKKTVLCLGILLMFAGISLADDSAVSLPLYSTLEGDMLKATYDANDDGVVDNSKQLGGKTSDYFQVDLDTPTWKAADADTLDGNDSASFVSTSSSGTYTGLNNYTQVVTVSSLSITGASVLMTTVTYALNAVVGNDSHDHTATTISGLGTADISGLDISDDTNLTAGDDITLTDDDLDVDATVTRDTEWNTVTKINTATIGDDFLSTSTALSGDVTGPYDTTVVDASIARDSEVAAATSTIRAEDIVNGPLGSGVYTSSITALGGDVTGPHTATVVGNDSHNHTGSTLSSVDISADTNLAATAPITLSGDTIVATLGSGNSQLEYSTNTVKQLTQSFDIFIDSATTNYLSAFTMNTRSLPYAVTFTTAYFTTNSGTITIDMDYVDEGDPYETADSTDVITGTISVGTGSRYGGSSFISTALPANKKIRITGSATSGTPNSLTGKVEYTINR